MRSGVSNIMPLGAAVNPGCVGVAEWQTAHRTATMLCTCAKSLLPEAVAASGFGGARAIATPARVSTPNASGSGDALPWWRATKKIRTNAPIIDEAISTAQL